jgi:hypothetical protein
MSNPPLPAAGLIIQREQVFVFTHHAPRDGFLEMTKV